MPLTSSVHQNGAIPQERDHHITHEGGNWILRSKSTGKVLGTHPTKEAAEAQERAMQANKHSMKVTVEDMRSICSSCAEKMVKDGVKHFYLNTDKEDLGLPMTVDSGVSDRLRQFAIDFSADTKNIKGVEIFAAGTWNGDAYTDSDLDTLVNAFKATKDALKPYLKLGHSEDQTLLAEDSLPAAGWVANIYRVGHKLLADFCDIPNKIADLIKAKAYKRVSSEIFVNVNVNGKKYPYALKAVALLGGETPAVQTLDDIHALYALDQSVLAYANKADVRAYQMDTAEIKEEYSMEVHVKDGAPDAVQHPGHAAPAVVDNALPLAPAKSAPAAGGAGAAAQPDGDECYTKLATAYAELDGVKKQLSAMAPKAQQLEGANQSYKLQNESLHRELSETQSELVKSKNELKKIYSEKTQAEVKSAVEKFVQDKKILPSQAAALESLLVLAKESGVRKFKVGEKEFSSAEDLVREFISNGQVGLPTNPSSENGKDIALPESTDGKAVDMKIREFMAKTGEKSYTKAYVAVAAEIAKATSKKS